MKLIPLAAASIALVGCAATPETPPQSADAAPGRASEAVTASEAITYEDIEVAAVVELEPRSELESEEPCRRTTVTGSRISRVQCEEDLPESQRILNEEIVRSEIEYAREMAMVEEQMRAAQAAEEALRRMQGESR